MIKTDRAWGCIPDCSFEILSLGISLELGFWSFQRNALVLPEELHAAVVISPISWNDTFVANFAPVILVEKIFDAGENTDAAVPEFHFGGQVPNVVRGNETLERIIGVAEFVIHDRAEKADFNHIFPAIDCAGLKLIIRRVGRRLTVTGSGSELSIQHRDVAVERQSAVRTLRAAVDQRQNVEFSRRFKSNITRVSDIARGRQTTGQTDVAHLIVEREIKPAQIEIKIGQRLAAQPQFELKRVAFFEISIDDGARSGRN